MRRGSGTLWAAMPSADLPSLLHLDSGRNRLIGIGVLSAAVLFFSVLDAGVASVREGLIKLGYEEYVPTDLHLLDQE